MKKVIIGLIGAILGTAFVAYGATILFVPQGGTGASSFGQGWVNSSGGTAALSASTSPTVNYLTATSTSATSTFAFGISFTRFNQTATSTGSQGFNLTGGCFSINGTCIAAGGSVTSIATNYPITGGTITTTGSLSLAFGTTTANSWSALQNFTNATTSLGTFSTNTWFPYLASAAGTSLALDVNGKLVATSTVSTTTPNTWTQLQTFTNGFVSQASSTVSGLFSSVNASSTFSSVLTSLWIPNAASPSLSQTGQIALNTTSASSSVSFNDGTAQRYLFDETPSTFVYTATTTTNGINGTTTLQVAGSIRYWTMTQIGCNSQGGTANVQVGNGSASTTMVASTQSGTATTFTSLASNNTFNKGQIWYISIGTLSSANLTEVTCTYGKRFTS